MSSSICSNKGLSMVEVLIAVLLVNVGVLGLLSLQPSGWRLSAKSDFLGRAAGILHRELQINEMNIMNPNNANPCTTNPLIIPQTVWASGTNLAPSGDASFAVRTEIQDLLNGTWLVKVNVTPPGAAVGISDSLIVTRQENFRQ
jgi:Tfp pilus assembly protein PilV